MAKVLARPMFKLGGTSDGVGITSGFRRGYAFGSTGAQRDYLEERDKMGGAKEIINKSEVIKSGDGSGSEAQEWLDETTKEIFEQEPESKYGWSELFRDAYKTAAMSSNKDEWITNAADLALKTEADRKTAKKELPYQKLDALQKAAQIDIDRMNATRPTNIQEKKTAQSNADQLLSQYGSIEELMDAGAFAQWDHLMGLANDYWKPHSAIRYDIFSEMLGEMNDTLNIPKWPRDNPEEIRLFNEELNKRIQMYYSGYKPYTPGNAMGGTPIRRGYYQGLGPVMDQQTDMSMTENIQTPGGDMSMTENVDTTMMGPQAGMPAQTTPTDDPFVLLRARLPEEISDDVVRLIAYNPEAFADFADIETQDDVIAFNKKYGVELVVNTDEMSGAIA